MKQIAAFMLCVIGLLLIPAGVYAQSGGSPSLVELYNQVRPAVLYSNDVSFSTNTLGGYTVECEQVQSVNGVFMTLSVRYGGGGFDNLSCSTNGGSIILGTYSGPLSISLLGDTDDLARIVVKRVSVPESCNRVSLAPNGSVPYSSLGSVRVWAFGFADVVNLGAIPLYYQSGMALRGPVNVIFRSFEDVNNSVWVCPDAQPTATPTPTSTPTPTGTPVPTPSGWGVCNPGDLWCTVGEGYTMNASASGSTTGQYIVPLSELEQHALAEPGAWTLTMSGCNGRSGTNQALRMEIRTVETNISLVTQDTALSGNLTIDYHVGAPGLLYQDFADRSLQLIVSTGSNWGTFAFSCNIQITKRFNFNMSVSGGEYTLTAYNSRPNLWGLPVFWSFGNSAPSTTFEGSTEVDTGYNDVWNYSTGKTEFYLDGQGFCNLAAPAYCSRTIAAAQNPLYLQGTSSTNWASANKMIVRVRALSVPTATPTRTATGTTVPTVLLPTNTPTRTAFPTPTSDCQIELISIGGSYFSAVGDTVQRYIYTQNGVGLISQIDGSGAQLVEADGIIWTGSLQARASQITDGTTTLRVVICDNIPPAPTATGTATPTRPALPCPVADSIGVPVSPGNVSLVLRVGTRFVVAQATIFINVGLEAREIGPGNYQWDLGAGTFTAYSVTTPAIIYICVESTPTITATFIATETPGIPGVGSTAVCVAVPSVSPTIAFTMPDLVIVVPTLRPLASATPSGSATATASPIISVTAIVAMITTVQASMSTPAAAIQTASAGFSWQAGQNTAATAGVIMQPALSWLAVVNPANPAYTTTGGPLWAIAPFVLPVMPILVITIGVALVRFFLWALNWLLKFIDLIIKLVELIPFM